MLGTLVVKTLDSQRKLKPTPPVTVRRVYRSGREIIDVRRITHVRASPLPYHLERGWKKDKGVHRGYFRTRFLAFKGEILEGGDGNYKFYIFNPPQEILNGEHKQCFTSDNNGRFHIHFGVNSGSLDGGIMAVERLLTQSLNRR